MTAVIEEVKCEENYLQEIFPILHKCLSKTEIAQ